MLSFTLPWALGLLSAGLLVVLFYFLRMRFRRQNVSSTFLWLRLVEVNEGGARLRWRSLLLLALQLLTVIALVFALAGLQAMFRSAAAPGTLYVLDTSASMGAREPGQTATRMQRAVQAILDDRKRETGPAAVFSSGRKVFVSEDGSGLEAYLATVSVDDGEFVEARAAEVLGTWLQTSPGSWTGTLVSDGGLDENGRRIAAVFQGRWRSLPFALEAPNLGITDLRIEASPPRARITLFSGFAAAQKTLLSLGRDGAAVLQKDETVAPGVSTVAWPLDSAPEGLWKVSLALEDALPADNEFTTQLAASRRARVLHLGQPDAFLGAAFPGARYVERAEPTTEGGPWDLIVADDRLPRAKTNLITFGALPPGAPVFWGQPVEGSVSGTQSHPLSRWVPWDELQIAQGRGLVVQPGATVLAEAGGWPVAATWEKDGARYLVLGFNTSNSNLGLTPVLPVLMRNFRQAVLPQEDNALAANLRVGTTTPRAGTDAWKVVSPNAASLESVRRGGLWELTPRLRATFRWTDGAESGVIEAQLPATESDTGPRATVASPPETSSAGTRAQTAGLAGWLALAVVALLAVEWRLWNGRFVPRGKRGLFVLRVAACAAAMLALVGLALPWPTADRNLTLLLDVSPSLGPEFVESERLAALKLVDSLAPSDRVAVVAFAGEPRVISGLQTKAGARKTLEAAPLSLESSATDIGAALAAGAQLLTGEPGSSSQLVFTDGRANKGGGLDSLSVQARRFPISAVPLGRALGGVVGEGLELPDARPGDQTLIRWRAWADAPRAVTLELRVDGELRQSKRADLVTGANTAEFLVAAGDAGTRRVDVSVRDGTQPLGAAQASGLLKVAGRASVLVVRGPGAGSALPEALKRQGLPVLVRGPQGLPDSAEGYDQLSAVVLDNVAAPSLNDAQQARLKEWVAGGGGLLVIGGDASLGRGEYFSSALEELLPVQTDNRQRLQFTRSRLLFVVDHSGSMSEDVGSTTKLAAALGGIERSLDDLTVQDEVGLLEFDSDATWVLPFTPLTQKQTVLDALGKFSQGGGTDLTRALDEVTAAFGHPGPVKRHVILMTDGQTGGEDQFFKDFTETMKAAQVTMTVLGIGNDVNERLLRDLASGSDGVYYRAVGDDIPSILHKETVRVTRDLIQEGNFTPLAVGSAVGLGDPLPVRGYLVTKPKPLARVRWELRRTDGGRDPLYADWRYGAGRVAVFTSDSGTKWLSPWSSRPEYNLFWSQAVRALETGPRDKDLRLEVEVSASVAKVTVEALKDGRLRTGANLTARQGDRSYPLTETAPGRYEADIPVDSGLQLVSVSDRAGPSRASSWTWNPPGTELARGGVDWAALGRLTASTGGLLEPLASPQAPASKWSWAPLPLRDWLLGLALILYLVELGWRSTSLGQFAAARAVWSAWWKVQSRPWAKTFAPTPSRDEAEVERRTREAYKYLAGRKRG